MTQKINKDLFIDDVIKKEPILAEEFFKMGMMCIGCPLSQQETIERGCQAHGMNDKQIDKFIEALNKKLGKKEKKPQKKKPVLTPAKAESAKLKKKSIKKSIFKRK